MIFLITFFSFLLGSVIGSFLNVLVLRTKEGKSLDGRSICPHCRHQLGILDLIPIFSYFALSGKCRYCSHKFSIQYPLVEFAAALSFALLANFAFLPVKEFFGTEGFLTLVSTLFSFFVVSVLITISVYDLKFGEIPDRIVFPSIVIAVVYMFKELVLNLILTDKLLSDLLLQVFLDLLTTFLLSGAFLLLLLLPVNKGQGAMGGGDFKLSIFLGLALGWPLALIGVFLGFLTGAIGSVMLILLGKKTIKQSVPFGPFLALGSFLALLVGHQLLTAYLKTLGF